MFWNYLFHSSLSRYALISWFFTNSKSALLLALLSPKLNYPSFRALSTSNSSSSIFRRSSLIFSSAWDSFSLDDFFKSLNSLLNYLFSSSILSMFFIRINIVF